MDSILGRGMCGKRVVRDVVIGACGEWHKISRKLCRQLDRGRVRGRRHGIRGRVRRKQGNVLLNTGRIIGRIGCMRRQSLVHPVDLGELDAGTQDHLFYLWFRQVAPGVGANIRQAIPFVHAKFSYTDLDVQTVVVVLADTAFRQVVAQHVMVDILTPLDLVDQTSSRLCKDANSISKEVFPPLVLPIVGARWTSPRPHADEHTNFSPRPFVHSGFFQYLRGRVVCPGTLVDEKTLSDLNWFEGQAGG